MSRSKRIFWAPLGVLLAAAPAIAASNTDTTASAPTFYKDVLPILQSNCQTCHRPAGLNLGGMIAPMSFMSYQDVRPWAKSIARAVQNREMPPWHASRAYDGVFQNQRVLADREIETLVSWVKGGALAGDPSAAPPAPAWTHTEWAIGEPDLVLSLPEPFDVKDDIEDLNINIPTKISAELLPEDKYIVAMEYKPGSTAVHHIIGFTLPPGGSQNMAEGNLQMLGGIAPGTQPTVFPAGYGVKLYAGSTFVFQMHYHKEPGPGTGVMDNSQIAFKFADKPVRRLHITAVGDPRKLYIPANTKDVNIVSTETLDKDIEIVSLLPHMHLRGVYTKYTAKLPDGTSRDLLEVPHYDFNWQTGYEFNDLLKLPSGTTLEVTCGYDNTADNRGNPDPTRDVRWGESTNDEMNLGFMTWAYSDGSDADLDISRRRGGRGRSQDPATGENGL